MANLNSVTLIGRITRDIEVQRTQSGVPFARFSIAVDRPVSTQAQNQNGQQQQAQAQSQVDFIPVTVWNKQAENVAQYCGKGSLVAVSGALRTYKYQDKTNPDVNHTGFEVRAANVQFLVLKRPGGATNANANAGYGNTNVGNTNNGNGYAAYGNNNYAGNANNNAGGYNGANTGYAGGNGANGNNYNGGGYGGNAGYAGGNGDSAGYAGGYDSPVDEGDPFGNIQF